MGEFRDRTDAGRRLGDQLQAYRDADPLVLGLPRGGVKVAEAIALVLGCDLDVIVSRKLRAPDQPELAIGALAEGGEPLWNRDVIDELALPRQRLDAELERVRGELASLCGEYRSILEKIPIEGRCVLLTDDGVATGATLRAAIEAVAAQEPATLVVALPGGPRETLAEIARLPVVDEVVGLASPNRLWSVGDLYDVFDQLNAAQMTASLRNAARRRRAASSRGSRHPTR